MSHQEETTQKADQKEPPRFDYDVGYSKPPRDSWFAPGTSGNPGGRPKGSKNKPPQLRDKNLSQILRDELFRRVKIKSDEADPISVVRAVTQKLVISALDGDFRASQWVISASRALEAADAAQQEADYKYALEYKARCTEPFRALYEGPDRAHPIPNPDQVIIDERNRRAMFAGPRNESELARYLAGEDFMREEDAEEFAKQEEFIDLRKVESERNDAERRFKDPSSGSLYGSDDDDEDVRLRPRH
jgi:hypothetical protein